MALYIALWCVHFVWAFAQIRVVIWMRDGSPDDNPWIMALWVAVLAASAATLVDATRARG